MQYKDGSKYFKIADIVYEISRLEGVREEEGTLGRIRLQMPSESEIAKVLRHMGGERHRIRIKGHNPGSWWTLDDSQLPTGKEAVEQVEKELGV